MAVAIPAVIAGISAYSAGFLGIAAGLGAAFAAAGASLVLSGLSAALAPKPKAADFGSFASIRESGITRQVRQPITERSQIYGEVRVSGPVALITSTEDNKYLHLVILLASHEVEEIGEIFINDVSIAPDMLDGSGFVTSGLYEDLVRIKKHLGADSQTADADLVAEVPQWTGNHRLRGIAYIYARLEWDRDTFPGGIPNFSAWVKGKKILDTRDAGTRYTANVALFCNDYLLDTKFGLSTDAADILDDTVDDAANTCEEFISTADLNDTIESADPATDVITLTGVNDRLQYQTGDRVRLTGGSLPTGLSAGVDYYVIPYQRKDNPRIKLASSLANALAGTAINITATGTGTITKKAEPRYFGGGVFKSSAEHGKNLQELLSGMAGQAVYSGGQWRILAGEYQTPILSLNTDDLADGLKVTTKISRRDRFNQVTGVYISQLNDGNPADYPLIKNDTYATADNGEIMRKNLDLPVTQRPHTAQRIAKIDLERARQEIIFSAVFKLKAFTLDVGDNFYFTSAKHGWNSKIFEVIEWSLATAGGQLGVSITARENDSSVYAWNNGEETSVDPAPNSELPSPFDVSPPTSLSVTPVEIPTASGDLTYEFIVAWTASVSAFVINGGFYEVEFKRSADADWRTSFDAKDTDTSITVKQVEPGVNYDVRMRSVNSVGVRSSYNSLLGFNVSSPSGATITIDYDLITGAVVDSFDYDLISVTASINYDYEDIT